MVVALKSLIHHIHALNVYDDYDENHDVVDVDEDNDNDGELPQPWSHGGDCGCLQLLSSFGTFPAKNLYKSLINNIYLAHLELSLQHYIHFTKS